jgi:uncharacterized membrane protein
MTVETSPKAQAFLASLHTALQGLPQADRVEIVREIESHLLERGQAGQLESALAALGKPDLFARTYLENLELNQALVRPNPMSLLFAVLNRSGRSLIAFVVGFIAVLLYLFSGSFALIVLLKQVTPANVGWWDTPGHLEFGAIYGTHPMGHELLGYWVIPISAGAAVACYLAATQLLKVVGRILVSRSSSLSLARA